MHRLALPLLLAAALVPAAAHGWGGACPSGPPLALVQNDAGSGRDAGDLLEEALPLPGEGYFWGSLDPPLQVGLQDQHDWYRLDVPAGARNITVEVKSLGKVLNPGGGWPFVYWLEVFRAEEVPVAFLGSWEAPFTFASPGGETLHVDLYIVPLMWDEACATAPWSGPAVPALPAEPQLYRVLVACAPACAA